jgi:hypothetical protein
VTVQMPEASAAVKSRRTSLRRSLPVADSNFTGANAYRLFSNHRASAAVWSAVEPYRESSLRVISASERLPVHVLHTCPSRIRRQAATGSWTRSWQWETQRARRSDTLSPAI